MVELKYHIFTHLQYSTFVHAIALVNKTKYHHNVVTGRLLFLHRFSDSFYICTVSALSEHMPIINSIFSFFTWVESQVLQINIWLLLIINLYVVILDI